MVFLNDKSYIFASESPRRKALIKLLDRSFVFTPSKSDEKLDRELSFEEAIMDIALQKALSVSDEYHDRLVLGADTLVVLNKDVFGKPKNEEQAYEMLSALSGETHSVITGVAMVRDGQHKLFYSKANVTFDKMSDQEIRAYIQSEEPFNKAGAYAIQGLAAKHITKIEGDYYAVMGLPLAKLYQHIKAFENNTLF